MRDAAKRRDKKKVENNNKKKASTTNPSGAPTLQKTCHKLSTSKAEKERQRERGKSTTKKPSTATIYISDNNKKYFFWSKNYSCHSVAEHTFSLSQTPEIFSASLIILYSQQMGVISGGNIYGGRRSKTFRFSICPTSTLYRTLKIRRIMDRIPF